MSLFGKIMGEGAEGFLSRAGRGIKGVASKAARGASESAGSAAAKLRGTRLGKGVNRVRASTPFKAGKNIARGAGEGVKEMAGSVRKAGSSAVGALKNPKSIKSRLTKIARNPAKMKALGKKLSKYGAAGAAGYGAAKLMGKDKEEG